MILLPPHLYKQFQTFSFNSGVKEKDLADCVKWLRYFLDFCEKYHVTGDDAKRSQMFLRKLHDKKQSEDQCRHVLYAVTLYFEMLKGRQQNSGAFRESEDTYNLFVKVLFGCGLRLFEGLQIRVGDFNFHDGKLLVHGKGKKDRTVPIPETITQELKAQIEKVAKLHDQDLAAGYDGVFLDDDIEKKYPNAPKEFIHQWVFPQKSLTLVAETGERRRYHLHESQLQGALYHAVRSR